MAGAWFRSATFAHGVLILPIAGALLIRQRGDLARSIPTVAWWAVPVLALCVVVWLLGVLVQANVVSQFAVMAMIPATLLFVLGPSVVSSMRFPVLFSLLAVPVGEFLIAPMMNLTANGSVTLLHLSHVPVYQDGWLISIPAGDFLVADACSGVRYLIGALTSGVLFAYLFFNSWKKRLFFISFTIILTVIANVIRAYIIILLAHVTEMRVAAGVDHFIYGWFMFALLLGIVFAVGLRFADGVRSAGASGVLHFGAILTAQGRRHLSAAAAAAALLAGGPVALARLSDAGQDEGLVIPVSVAGQRLAGDVARPRWLQPDTGWDMRHLGFRGSMPFEVHVFRGQTGPNGRDLTGLRDQLAVSEVTLVADEEATVPSAIGPVVLREMRFHEGSRKLLAGYWFEVGPRRTANPVTAKLMEVGTMLNGEHKKPVLITVVLETKDLDQPSTYLSAILGELASGVASFSGSAPTNPALRVIRIP
jgi:exosortase A